MDSEVIVVKAEADFYSSLEVCPNDVFVKTRGIRKFKEDNVTFLAISRKIIDPASLFYRYLEHVQSKQVFGSINPLFQTSTLNYEGEKLVGLNHFTTRLLLTFFEVQMALGFSGDLYYQHQAAIEHILQGKQDRLLTNYYHPFNHEDNAGIHYVLNKDGLPGYSAEDWDTFLKYSAASIQAAFQISPADFGETIQGMERKIQDYIGLVSEPYLRTGILNVSPVRHLGILIYEILYFKSSADFHLIPNPRTGKPMKYIPLIDCLLDMPYRNGGLIVFQSTCAGK